MSKYTFEMRELIDTFGKEEVKSWFMEYDLKDYLTDEEIAVIEEKGCWSKEKLAERIVQHYFLREIGTEAPGAFHHYAVDMMQEIMETYAPLIYSASIKYDPLVNVNYSETLDRNTDNHTDSTSRSNTDGSNLTVSSDTPQGEIRKTEILNGKYATATAASENNTNSNDSASSDGNGNEHYVKTIKGNSGVTATSQAMIKQYRDIVRALNTEIVYELEPLFMGVY